MGVVIDPFLKVWKAKRLSPTGHEGRYDLREIINALFYQNRTGCQRMLLPHDCRPGRRCTTTSAGGVMTALTRAPQLNPSACKGRS